MATEREYERRLKELQSQLRKHQAIAEELGTVLNQRTQNILAHDQAASLDNLKARVMKAVDDVRLSEIIASNKFLDEKLATGLMDFAAGALGALMTHRRDPLWEGASRLRPVLGRKAPFGTVLVAVGEKGLPEDVTVVPLSGMARDSNQGEMEIQEALRKRGKLLMAPEAFAALIDKLKLRVLDRSVSLPLSFDKIASVLSGKTYTLIRRVERPKNPKL
jgi:hypothetical protein